MSAAWMERALWILSLGLLAMTGAMVVHADPPPVAAAAAAAFPPTMPPGPTADELADAVGDIRNGDLFRAQREPVADQPQVPVQVMQGMPPRPTFIARGLIGGPPWSALVEGIPGSDGVAVLRVGQTVNGITLRAVRRDTIILQAKDTTWKLTVRQAW